MAIFKCKMCGGTLEINNNETVAVCEYCGTKQTLPKLDDEKRVQLYDRANHFRRENEFDKAMGIYEMILSDDKEDCESYWGLVLCRYGIEYVEDPRTHKRIPTVNRAQFTSIFDDDDYKNAIKYADGYQKDVYEAEATVIDKIQKGILEISNKEEPFDVFICYKETDSHGNRTQDSVYAQDIYTALTKEGHKVFFSRITLEDKLGSAYEPYIFAALNSAKVMLVVGTEKDNFNAVWVKNEWSRYISLIKAGKDKTLIPVYKDISPYDMPEEFQYLQSQDMGKIGFMQDLVRGISKLIDTNKTVKETFVVSGGNTNVAPLLERAFMFLEDADWASADEYCEKVLDIDPKNAQAYLGKLMAELKVRIQEELVNCTYPFSSSANYEKILKFGSSALVTDLSGYIESINARIEAERIEKVYNEAKSLMNSAKSEDDYKKAAEKFSSINNYKDSDLLIEQCLEKSEVARKDAIYYDAEEKIYHDNIDDYELAIKLLKSISGWKDADEQIIICQRGIKKLEENFRQDKIENAKRENKRKKIIVLGLAISCMISLFIILLPTVIVPKIDENKLLKSYNDAVALMSAGEYTEAIAAFEALEGYKDSVNKIEECNVYIYGEEVWNKVKSVNIGDTYIFGTYEQDNNLSNGSEEIEWQVLAKEGTRIFVISKYAIDCKPYNTTYTNITWEESSLREWLNNGFIEAAFSKEEQAMIPMVTVSPDEKYDSYGNLNSGTQEKVFLLSKQEAWDYFDSNDERKCQPTDYAISNGARKHDNINCNWWLRSRGYAQNFASVVNFHGEIPNVGSRVKPEEFYEVSIRPVLWIEFDN